MSPLSFGSDFGQDFSKIFIYFFNYRAQLKRHTSSLINFSIDIQFISQKVNMPLLRLLNQIVTMHMNVKETNEELRENRPVDGATGSNPPSAKSSTAGQDPSPFIVRHKRSSSGLYNQKSFRIYKKFNQFHQTCPDLSRLVQTCPNLSRLYKYRYELFLQLWFHYLFFKIYRKFNQFHCVPSKQWITQLHWIGLDLSEIVKIGINSYQNLSKSV